MKFSMTRLEFIDSLLISMFNCYVERERSTLGIINGLNNIKGTGNVRIKRDMD